MRYIYQEKDWPHFTWDSNLVEGPLADVRNRQGRLLGRMDNLGFTPRAEAALHTQTMDVIKSSEIEGILLNPAQVRSSVARRLGLDVAGTVHVGRDVDGVVEMMLDGTRNYSQPLTKERLFAWHAALFPTGHSGIHKIEVASWRSGIEPMRVISGHMGQEQVHFQAPPAAQVAHEMEQFVEWFNAAGKTDPVLNAAIAHLWFLTIHPFDDGNGRIARAIADMQLARADGTPLRFYSMSTQIRKDRTEYYEILESSQKGTTDITRWLLWFLNCLQGALDETAKSLSAILSKAHFWDSYSAIELNSRQRLIINKMLDGFEGKLNTSKWAKINKCSQDTALRDVQDLIEKGILKKEEGGGRSTSYLMVGHG